MSKHLSDRARVSQDSSFVPGGVKLRRKLRPKTVTAAYDQGKQAPDHGRNADHRTRAVGCVGRAAQRDDVAFGRDVAQVTQAAQEEDGVEDPVANLAKLAFVRDGENRNPVVQERLVGSVVNGVFTLNGPMGAAPPLEKARTSAKPASGKIKFGAAS